MQIIQTIRDRGAAIVIVVISLSLIGFILMDSRSGSNNAAGSLGSSIGKVNGSDIELGDFNKRVQQAEARQQQQTGKSLSTAESNQVREQTWQQMIAEKVFFAEADKLGIDLTSKEFSSILLSNDPANPLLQEQGLRDPNTGQLDVAKAQEALVNIKKLKGEQLASVDAQLIEPLKLTNIANKYSGLLSAAAYYPSWMKVRDAALNADFAVISYVAVPYTEISDSAVKVSDADIMAYVNKNKGMFKQEAGRKISYVTFSQLPTAADSNATRTQVMELRDAFASDSNALSFVAKNGSIIEYQDAFLPKSRIPSSMTDSIVNSPQGAVVGPYVDQGAYVIAKVVGSKSMPDSVKARHILVGLQDPQTGQPLRDDPTAKALADSILKAINTGADFSMLAAKYSADGSKDKGGDLGTFGYGQMVPEFNDFTFNKPVGSIDVVRTQYGYHVIKIDNQSNFNPAYKVAFVAKEIVPSEKTINDASMSATKASAEKNAQALVKYAAANGLGLKYEPTLIKENDFAVAQFQDGRQLVRWAFDAEKGEVSEPFNIGNQFVVATVDNIYSKGTQDAASARSGAEVIVIKEKKAQIIRQKIGENPTLEKAAAAYGKQIEIAGADSSITFGAQMINNLGIEAKVVGAAFNKAYLTKASPAIDGTNGVYVIKVNSVTPMPADPARIAQQEDAKMQQMRSATNAWFESLRSQADIKDKRSKHF